jgi:rare lipoprotein A
MPGRRNRAKTFSGLFPLFRISFLFVLSTVAFLFLLTSCATMREEAQPGAGYAIASWYGSEFNGKPTASGETFNMYAHTCAHRQYPFGTVLKVTNVENGKEVECTVNDRGPFVSGRDIDLSYASAKEIGLIGVGTGSVYLEVAGRNDSYVKRVKVETQGRPGPFAIQIGSFTDSSNADRLKKALDLEYGDVSVQEALVRGRQFYRVRVGKFDSLTKAISFAGKLGFEGYPTLVVEAD